MAFMPQQSIELEHARSYVLGRLERELAPDLTYHCVAHTRDDVVPAAERLAQMEGVADDDLIPLLTGAWFHDLGMIEGRDGHELASVRIATQALPGFGYTPTQVAVVCGIILATRLPQEPHTPLEEIMADADLDVLGRDDFFARNALLYAELVARGMPPDEAGWHRQQLRFMQEHRYFTASARALREAGKLRNLEEVARRLGGLAVPETVAGAAAEVDRLTFLRAVSIFADTDDETLADVAQLLEPLEIAAGTRIIDKGDRGDCMYIIARGRVRVHDGERTLNYLGVADFFGEMALLDAQPRVASVTAEEATQLLRLDQDPFYTLMHSRSGVAGGVIRVLCRHLRGRVRDMHEDFEYMQQMARLTAAAAALEAGVYDPRSVDSVAERGDALGQLARVFRRMAGEVQARETRLRREVQELRIQIDEAKKAREVSEITESDYFQTLQQRAKRLRGHDPSPSS